MVVGTGIQTVEEEGGRQWNMVVGAGIQTAEEEGGRQC
jgi:hypothetical protein